MIVPPGENNVPISDIRVEFSGSAFALRTLRAGEYQRLERLFSLRYGDEYEAQELLQLRQQRVLVPFLQAAEDKSKHCICVRQTQTREMLGMILITVDDSAAKKVLVEESWFIHDTLFDKVFIGTGASTLLCTLFLRTSGSVLFLCILFTKHCRNNNEA